jgi:hypothetical protein
MIRPGEYPQVERRAGDRLTRRRLRDPHRTPATASGTRPAIDRVAAKTDVDVRYIT